MKKRALFLRSQILALFFVALFGSILGAIPFTQTHWYSAEKVGANIKTYQAEVSNAVSRMKTVVPAPDGSPVTNTTSLWQEIDARGGSDVQLLRLKAIHENGGKLRGKSIDFGYCAYQITRNPKRTPTAFDTVDYAMANNTIFPSYKLPIGSATPAQREAFLNLLNIRADLCVEAGLNVLKQKRAGFCSKYSGVAQTNCVICAYGGQTKATFPTVDGYFMNGQTFATAGNRCPASEEVRIIAKFLDSSAEGASPFPTGDINNVSAAAIVNDDPNSPDYNKVTYKINGDTVSSDMLLACADSSNAIARDLAMSAKAYQSAAIVRVKEAFSASIAADQSSSSQSYIRGDMKKRSCIGYVFTIMDTVRMLISKVTAIEAIIEAIVKTLLDQVCNYVATAINNVLASVCLPIPNLSLSLSLPSLSSKSCNGLSLLSVLQMQSNVTKTVPADDRGRAWPHSLLQAPPFLGAPNLRRKAP